MDRFKRHFMHNTGQLQNLWHLKASSAISKYPSEFYTSSAAALEHFMCT